MQKITCTLVTLLRLLGRPIVNAHFTFVFVQCKTLSQCLLVLLFITERPRENGRGDARADSHRDARGGRALHPQTCDESFGRGACGDLWCRYEKRRNVHRQSVTAACVSAGLLCCFMLCYNPHNDLTSSQALAIRSSRQTQRLRCVRLR